MPASPAACSFDEPESRLPGLDVDTICPGRLMHSLGWLFQLADYMPKHLPRSGGPMDQPALIMDAAEAAMIAMAEWRDEHGTDK